MGESQSSPFAGVLLARSELASTLTASDPLWFGIVERSATEPWTGASSETPSTWYCGGCVGLGCSVASEVAACENSGLREISPLLCVFSVPEGSWNGVMVEEVLTGLDETADM